MKNTYTGTLFHPTLEDAEIEINMYCVPKYSEEAQKDKVYRVKYTNVTAWDIVSGEDAKEIEINYSPSTVDDNHEYLVLHFNDGSTATFRNSYVAMFIW